MKEHFLKRPRFLRSTNYSKSFLTNTQTNTYISTVARQNGLSVVFPENNFWSFLTVLACFLNKIIPI